MDRPPTRDRATVSRELAEVERYLRDTPPHSGSGHREALAAKRTALQRELARIDAERRRGA